VSISSARKVANAADVLVADGGSNYAGTDVEAVLAEIAGLIGSGSMTTEQVQDILGAALVGGTGVTVTYDDTAGTVTVAVGSTVYRSGGTDVPVADGGTGASDAATARSNLGVAAVSHTHPESDITNLTTDLAGKAAASHTHPESDITNLTTDLAAKAPLASPTFTGTVTVPTPSNSTDAATKGYVDTSVGTPTALLSRVLAGMTIPPNSLDRWKAGPGLPGTPLNGSITNSATSLAPTDSSFFPNTAHRVFTIDSEEFFSTGGETTTTVNVDGGINGTARSSHADKAEIIRSKVRRVMHIGDSVAEGVTTSTTVAGDGWSVRAARVVSKRLGGEIGQMWPMWRSTAISQVHQEYVLTGAASAGVAAYDLGPYGGVVFTGGSGNGFVWTRPAGLTVQAVDILWVDYSSTSWDWQYSLDGGSTWVGNPITSSIYTSGTAKLRRSRIVCDNPTTIRVRAYNGSANKTIVLPYVPLTTWSTPPTTGVTEGVMWANLGAAGQKLRTLLNSRTVTDGVTNGTTTLTSATAAFVANDVGSTIYVNGAAYTISSRTNGTTVVLSGSPATATGVRLTIFQGDNTGDRMAQFLGHHGSTFPDLVICGPWDNDMGTSPTSNGDTNPDAMTDMLTYLVGKIQPVADVLLIAPHEDNTFSTSLQAQYRTAIHGVGTALNCAVLDLYDAFAAYGYTGYTAVNAGGFMYDSVHFSALGNQWMGSHLARVLGVV
jgi:lysophospholipase L1-like esterase